MPDSISPFDRPLTLISVFNIVYFSLIQPESCLLITPVAGTAICFYSVNSNGSPDPASWHGGLSLKQLDKPGNSSATKVCGGSGEGEDKRNHHPSSNVGKWTLQLFAKMPPSKEENHATFLQARLMK